MNLAKGFGMSKADQEVVTFKASRGLVDALKCVSNRSQFIRNALLSALKSVCPLCSGKGAMTPRQRKHWEAFAERHSVRQCQGCHETYLVCSHERIGRHPEARRSSGRSRCAC
jgi:hypothetical protein